MMSESSSTQSEQKENIGQILLDKWLKESELVGEGRTASVYKIPFEGKHLALKMVDYSNPPPYALEEFENEVDVLRFLLAEKGKFFVLYSYIVKEERFLAFLLHFYFYFFVPYIFLYSY